MNEILVSYIEDLRDSLVVFNEALMSIQGGTTNSDIVNSIFRVAHTIKGNSAAMNFMKIQRVMHTMEDLLSEVRNGTRQITDNMVNLLFSCHDFLEDCLEVVEKDFSDENVESENLLEKLIALKNNSEIKIKTEAAVKSDILEQANQVSNNARDINFDINMPADLWELLYENIKNGGYHAYYISIRFMKNSSMKAVRAWMLFDRIDQSGILVYSNPPRLSENSFSSTGETPFDSGVIDAAILCEHEISDLVADLKETPDIENVEAKRLLLDEISKKVDFIKRQRNVIDQIQEIGVDLLGVDQMYLGEQSVKIIVDKTNAVVSSQIAHGSSPVNIIAQRMHLAFGEVYKSKKRIPVSERENIIFLCHGLEECILAPENLKNANLVSAMYRRLDELIEVISVPDHKMGEILASSGLITSADADIIASKQKEANLKYGQAAVKEKLVSALDVVTAMKSEKTQPAATAHAQQGESGFVRVPVAKVDGLIDMLSELMIYNSQLEQVTALVEAGDAKLANILSRTEKLIKEIQGLSMTLRMIEVKQTFNRLTRVARDTATDLGKKIIVKLEGEDTEIDRSAIEKLWEPLMHMVRNSVSHGIEENEDRTAIGKSPEGLVTIAGYRKRNHIYIEVRDDGRGINTKKVYDKAKEKGLISDTREYTEEEICKFIFLPGFSTQESVNNISGRGVGMNIVEEVVTKLGGKTEIETELGAGSTFRIKLPINLAVVNGIIIEMQGIRYIIPTMCAKRFFVARDKDLVSLQGENRAIKLDDGSIVSVISKEKIFGISDALTKSLKASNDEEKKYEMVLLETDKKTLVLNVDKIIGRQDVVTKPLAADYASVPYSNSASILSDGVVSLILDIDSIFKMSQPS